MGWGTDDGHFVLWWLLGYAAVHVALGPFCWLRGRSDRAVIRRVKREGIGPVEASRQADGEFAATMTALLLLVHQGAITVADDGGITAVPEAPEPSDPVLAALLTGLRQRESGRATLHQVRKKRRFAAYRDLVDERAPQVRWFAEPCHGVIIIAVAVICVGMVVQGLVADEPVPFLGDDSATWLLAIWPIWALLLWPALLVWPGEYSRRWRGFNRYCRARADEALAGVPVAHRLALLKGASKPEPPTPPRRKPESADGRPNDGDLSGWADANDGGSCGSGCGGCGN